MSYDVIVIGAGLAGLSAALRMSEEGRRVLVVAKGVGAIQLAGGTIDVLGYSPEPVAHPVRALAGFTAARPEHPYARVTLDGIRRALEWFKGAVATLPYVGSVDTNLLLPTAVGVAKPAALAPESFAAGDLSAGGRYAIVGLPALKDFYAAYLVGNLERARTGGPPASARALELTVPVREADVTPLGFARLFDDPEFRKAVIRDLRGRVEPGEGVGFPAVLGLEDPVTVWRELGDGLGGRVFEIPTLPPSVPGIRLFRVLKGALRARGARLLLGSTVIGAQTDGRRVTAVVTESAARPLVQRARHFVLASGGFAAGALEMDSSWTVREKIFGLPVAGVPARGEQRFSPGYLDEHRMARAGLATDGDLRPADANGAALYGNLYAAGAVLAGAEPWREKSGDGISLATGYHAAGRILEAA